MAARKPARVVALTIAGSDPGGGAGLQADLKTFAALGVYGYSVLTQIIAQNSAQVFQAAALKPAMVAAQIEALVAESLPHAIKTGVLGNAAVVETVARAIAEHHLPAPVVDPVMLSSSGVRLLDRGGERALAHVLIPIARVVTPNVPEAQALTGIAIDGLRSMREAARRIAAMGARAVVIKGGHLASASDATDLLYDRRRFIALKGQRLNVADMHGTGCAFSAAIAAHLAHGLDLEAAVRGGKRFVTGAMRRGFVLGHGRPLLDHFTPR